MGGFIIDDRRPYRDGVRGGGMTGGGGERE